MLETPLQDKIERYRTLVSKSFYVENPTLADPELGDLFFYLPNRSFMMLESSLTLLNVQILGSRDIVIPPLYVDDAFRYVNIRLSEEGDKVVAEYVHGGGRFYSEGEDLVARFRGAKLDPVDVSCSKRAWLRRELKEFFAREDYTKCLHLKRDSWADIMGIQFRSSPKKKHYEGEEERQPLVYFALDKPLDEIVSRTGSHLLSEVIDKAIIGTPFFADHGQVKELRGDRFRYVFSNCIHCGGGLMGKACTHCDTTFEGDLYDPWYCAPPKKVVEFLKSEGYIMPLQMRLARWKEREAPSTTGPMPKAFNTGSLPVTEVNIKK